jgi:phosphoribosylformimino-5-aminoimidazole carboxamide ribotide isomerase
MKLIPAIDLHNGNCVRLRNGDFDRVTRYDVDAAALAERYAGLGVDDLHIVDLDGARVGQQQNQEIVRRVVNATALSVQLGGGIRSSSTIDSWLDVGVHRVVIGSVAVTEPEKVVGWLSHYGADAIVLAFDVHVEPDGRAFVATHGWQQRTRQTLDECMDTYAAAGLRHVLCTDISRDGALAGPNLELYTGLLQRYPEIELQASGGIRDLEDLLALRRIGSTSAISGRALLDSKITDAEIRTFLPAA